MSTEALDHVQLLSGLSMEQRGALAAHLNVESFAKGHVLSTPAAPMHALVFVLAGSVSVEFPGGTIASIGPGEHFGVQTVVGGSPVPATIRTTSDCTLAALPAEHLAAIEASRPDVACRLIHAMLEVSVQRAHALAGQTSAMVPERSLPRAESVSVTVSGVPRLVKVGTPYRELLQERVGNLPVVAALVDRKATSLSSRVSSSVLLEPLTASHWEGQRIFRLSLALLALEAAKQVDGRIEIRVGPSVGYGVRLLVPGLGNAALAEFARRVEERMQVLVAKGAELREEFWTIDEARSYFLSADWREAEALLSTWHESAVPMVSYGTVYALNSLPMLPNVSTLDRFHLLCDEDMLLLVFGTRSLRTPRPSELMPVRALTDVGEEPKSARMSTRELIVVEARSAARNSHGVSSEEQAWLKALDVTSVGAFNRACVRGSVPELIRVSEGFQEKRLTVIADEIQRRIEDVDVVCIAGPSSSGKTTFIRRLCVQLQVNGINPVALGLDDYYVDRTQTPRDSEGDWDFEALEALDLPLLHEHLRGLLAGDSVASARYDFVSGKSHPHGGKTIRLGQRDVLLMEGIHGLNPVLWGGLPQDRLFRIFVCPLAQLSFDHLTRVHASDVRLIRRIVRDRHGRGHSAADTIARWPKVRAGERQHIYPHQSHADAVFDTSLIYELSVLRVYAERYLLEVPRDRPEYTTAFRLLHLLNRFVSIYPDHVPPTSILREFIGGSGFEY